MSIMVANLAGQPLACSRHALRGAGPRRLLHFHQSTGRYVVDESKNGNVRGHQRMAPDSPDVINNRLFLFADGKPFHEATCRRTVAMLRIGPGMTVELCSFKTIGEQV